jgi:probable dihydroxyacetone kinase regulator
MIMHENDTFLPSPAFSLFFLPFRVIILSHIEVIMENKRDLTKELLAGCFKELMLTTPFDKITIKMITDRAGLIRPTFYKHFQDKYEVLEWVFETEVAASVDLLITNHMELDAVVMLCRCLGRDRKFYRRAWEMEPGPNSFETILTRYVYQTFLKLADRFSVKTVDKVPVLTPEMISTYYTYGLVNVIRDWITSNLELTPEELAESYQYLLSHSVLDLIKNSN